MIQRIGCKVTDYKFEEDANGEVVVFAKIQGVWLCFGPAIEPAKINRINLTLTIEGDAHLQAKEA